MNKFPTSFSLLSRADLDNQAIKTTEVNEFFKVRLVDDTGDDNVRLYSNTQIVYRHRPIDIDSSAPPSEWYGYGDANLVRVKGKIHGSFLAGPTVPDKDDSEQTVIANWDIQPIPIVTNADSGKCKQIIFALIYNPNIVHGDPTAFPLQIAKGITMWDPADRSTNTPNYQQWTGGPACSSDTVLYSRSYIFSPKVKRWYLEQIDLSLMYRWCISSVCYEDVDCTFDDEFDVPLDIDMQAGGGVYAVIVQTFEHTGVNVYENIIDRVFCDGNLDLFYVNQSSSVVGTVPSSPLRGNNMGPSRGRGLENVSGVTVDNTFASDPARPGVQLRVAGPRDEVQDDIFATSVETLGFLGSLAAAFVAAEQNAFSFGVLDALAGFNPTGPVPGLADAFAQLDIAN